MTSGNTFGGDKQYGKYTDALGLPGERQVMPRDGPAA
jgi:hypothetical protein